MRARSIAAESQSDSAGQPGCQPASEPATQPTSQPASRYCIRDGCNAWQSPPPKQLKQTKAIDALEAARQTGNKKIAKQAENFAKTLNEVATGQKDLAGVYKDLETTDFGDFEKQIKIKQHLANPSKNSKINQKSTKNQ